MGNTEESASDRLWKEYGGVFTGFDDLSLARWMAQTLGQLRGGVWRLSHPLIGSYRLAAQIGHDRQIWLKRLASAPSGYIDAPCCRAPQFPMFTRDIFESGLICLHCGETLQPFEELAPDLQPELRAWADEYAEVHAVAHWDDRRRKSGDYNQAYEKAAKQAERLLARARETLFPRLLDHFPAVTWEDSDECLDVTPEDLA